MQEGQAIKSVDELMRQAVADGVFPGGVLLISKDRSIVFCKAYGHANIFTGRPVNKHTVFDLASLTKPLATTLAIIKLIEKRQIDLNHTIGSILPPFKHTDKSQITIRDLLTHQSGLPAHRPYYQQLRCLPPDVRQNALRNLLVKERLIYPVGKNPVYSDLGFMILKWAIETICGQRLDRFLQKEIYQPLGLQHLFFPGLDAQVDDHDFAATEKCPWRKTLLEGIVHDDNAYIVGGIEGHAGLFGTAGDVHCMLLELLTGYHGQSRSRLFRGALLHRFFECQPDAQRALGFDSPSVPVSSCGRYFSTRTVGHLGFTGTSFWMDLERSVIVVLLTNRVHPTRNNMKIKVLRPVLHDAVMQAMGLTKRELS